MRDPEDHWQVNWWPNARVYYVEPPISWTDYELADDDGIFDTLAEAFDWIEGEFRKRPPVVDATLEYRQYEDESTPSPVPAAEPARVLSERPVRNPFPAEPVSDREDRLSDYAQRVGLH